MQVILAAIWYTDLKGDRIEGGADTSYEHTGIIEVGSKENLYYVKENRQEREWLREMFQR